MDPDTRRTNMSAFNPNGRLAEIDGHLDTQCTLVSHYQRLCAMYNGTGIRPSVVIALFRAGELTTSQTRRGRYTALSCVVVATKTMHVRSDRRYYASAPPCVGDVFPCMDFMAIRDFMAEVCATEALCGCDNLTLDACFDFTANCMGPPEMPYTELVHHFPGYTFEIPVPLRKLPGFQDLTVEDVVGKLVLCERADAIDGTTGRGSLIASMTVGVYVSEQTLQDGCSVCRHFVPMSMDGMPMAKIEELMKEAYRFLV
jgi:hypothetical protein